MASTSVKIIRDKRLFEHFFSYKSASKSNLKSIKEILSPASYQEILRSLSLDNLIEIPNLAKLIIVLENRDFVEFYKQLSAYEQNKAIAAVNNLSNATAYLNTISLGDELDNFVNEFWKKPEQFYIEKHSERIILEEKEVARLFRRAKEIIVEYMKVKSPLDSLVKLAELNYNDMIRPEEAELYSRIEVLYALLFFHVILVKEFITKSNSNKSSRKYEPPRDIRDAIQQIDKDFKILKSVTPASKSDATALFRDSIKRNLTDIGLTLS